ncbi:activator of HSP90 ATPase [Tsuneonella deserti]|uniref:Activator of HSP90 ATPase n=1 Tax=Tsuneonella deserti TaxID=2035528 RepID=A0ABQ1SDA2_9SPHN|nr:SRPBCC family protein [Tsuneonella deserti]GGE05440.1 activator of HSP90 ATPase [Tsuneonella deserti]
MDQQASSDTGQRSRTTVNRKSDRELEVTRLFDAPPATVFKAWADPDLFRRWWVPKGAGMVLQNCQMDVRTGGTYRLDFAAGGNTMTFHGKYLEVVPGERIVWTNEEEEDGAVTTVVLEDHGGKTLLTFHELYPSKEALDEAITGAAAGLPTQLDQLEEMLARSV